MSQTRAPYATSPRWPTSTNAQIAAAFDELGDLYELDGAVSYRVIAYRTAAKAVRDVVGLGRRSWRATGA